MNMSHSSIAILGAACRFPGVNGFDALADVLFAGRDAVAHALPPRWQAPRYLHPAPHTQGRTYTLDAGLLENVSRFDYELFGISPREAMQMDPQQLLLLELAHEALEDAGLSRTAIAGQRVAVFVGASFSDHTHRRFMDLANVDAYFMTGTAMSVLANRLSHAFNLKGPSLTVDTACSSALVALHLACQALRAGEVDTAIIGAVNLLLSPQPFVGFAQATMLSPTGRCRPFSAEADGYVRSEGAGMIVLRRQDALGHADQPRAWVLGTGVNSDGHTNGISLPNGAAQAALLQDVYAASAILPEDLCYFEAHGTGTRVGDPIEAGAIGEALGRKRQTPLPVSSAKSSFGHLESASGIVGLFSAMLVASHRRLPCLAHCGALNPAIDFEGLGLRPLRESEALPAEREALIGVNSFGFGGTNAHAIIAAEPRGAIAAEPRGAIAAAPRGVIAAAPRGVIAAAPRGVIAAAPRGVIAAAPRGVIAAAPRGVIAAAPRGSAAPPPPLLLSAHSAAALEALAERWIEFLPGVEESALTPILRGAARGRALYSHRLAVIGDQAQAMAATLGSWRAGKPAGAAFAGRAGSSGGLGFVFSGNGAQWAGMGKVALARSAAFRDAVATLDTRLARHLGWSVARALDEADPESLRRTDIAQPLLFTVQVALVQTLQAGGIRADAACGHSVGEIAAAWACGALDLETAIAVLVARSTLQHRTHGQGRMAVCSLDAAAAQTLFAEHGLDLEVAAINAPHAITVAGGERDLDAFGAVLRDARIAFSELDLDYAFHSRLLDPIEADLRAVLAGVRGQPPRIPFVSTVTGTHDPALSLDADYWWQNVRAPVRFEAAVGTMVQLGIGTFLEIGPHPVLVSYIGEMQRRVGREVRVLASLTRRQDSIDPVLGVLAACHVAGHDITAGPLFDGERRTRGLPLYPYQRQSLAAAPPSRETLDITQIAPVHPLLGFPTGDTGLLWRAQLDTTVQPWLADHVVDGDVLLPATAMIDMALVAARARLPANQVLDIANLEIRRPLALEAVGLREIGLQIMPDRDMFDIVSRKRLSDEPWTVHATGQLAAGESLRTAFAQAAQAGEALEPAALYARAGAMRLHYGPEFQTVEQLILHDRKSATVTLRAPTAAYAARAAAGSVLDPAWADGALQGLIGLLTGPSGAAASEPDTACLFLPWRFGRVRHFAAAGAAPRVVHLAIARTGPRAVEATILLDDANGARVAEMTGVWFVRVPTRQPREDLPLWTTHLLPLPLLHQRMPRLLGPPPPAAASPAAGPRDAEILLDACIAAAAHAALAPLCTDHTASVDALVAQGLVHPASARLLHHLLTWLETDWLAARQAGAWRLATACNLPPATEIWRSLFADLPQACGELALLGAVLDDLPRILAEGPRDGGAGAPALMEQMLYDGPDGRAAIAGLVARVAAIARACPADRPLRILAVGAGGAALAHAIMQGLDLPAPRGLRYTLAALTTEASEAACLRPVDLPGRIVTWDLAETPPAELASGGFDLVIGAYAASLGPAGRDLPARLAPLLAPEGRLILAEPLPNRLWQLLLQIDPVLAEPPGERMLSLATWRALADGAGLRNVQVQMVGGITWPAGLIEAEAPAAEPRGIAQPGDSRRRLLLAAAPADGLTAALMARLRGAEVTRCDPAQLADALQAAPDRPVDIVLLPGDPSDATAALAELAAAAGALAARAPAALCLVTRGEPRGEPVAAALEAGLRVLGNELPSLAWRTIRVSRSLSDEEAASRVLLERDAASGEAEILLTPAARLAPRVRRLTRPAAQAPCAQLEVAQPGRLDSLRWREFTPPPPGPGQVAIRVTAAGINFRDLMWSLGVLPDEALIDGFAGPTLGLECAGTISAVGPGVTDRQIGERVMALAPASLATHTVTEAVACLPIPEGMDECAAATIPVAFMTVCHALGELARVQAGETVLVHGAAGGVGLAAIQYAAHRGAEVIATAGSEAKRALLRKLGVRHVFESRSLRFADEVLSVTDGRGVDVVLNSLSGEAMRRSLGLLAPFGRFIELGKRDFFADTSVGLRPLRRNAAYFGVDADSLARLKPARAAATFAEIAALLRTGALRPLPHRVMGFAAVGEAFRVMQWAGHVGKLVLAVDRAPPRVMPSAPAWRADPAGCVVITGGLAGFGLETARFFAARGARHLALLGRRGGDTPGAAAALASLQAQGCDARAYACDVADADALAAVLARVRHCQAPITGVVHAAMALHDGVMSSLGQADFVAAMAPKLAGALALDRLTRADPVALFLLFSSATTLLANPGQASYVAANAAMEAIAERRHAAGLPAHAIAWGPIADAGILTRDTKAAAMLARRFGSGFQTARASLDRLGEILAAPDSLLAPVSLSWDAARQSLRGLATARFADIARRPGTAVDEDSGGLAALLQGQTPEESRNTVQSMLATLVAEVLRLPPSRVQACTRLTEIGMDSLMGVELRLAVEERFGIHLPMVAITDETTLDDMVTMILPALRGDASPEPASSFVERLVQRYEPMPVRQTEPHESPVGD